MSDATRLQPDSQALTPIAANGAVDGAATAPSNAELEAMAQAVLGDITGDRVCRSCGMTVSNVAADRCPNPKCRRTLPGNRLAISGGTRGKGTPVAVARRVKAFIRGVVADRGGWATLSTVDRAAVSQLVELSRRLELQSKAIDKVGQSSARGQAMFQLFLSALKTFQTLAAQLKPAGADEAEMPTRFTLCLHGLGQEPPRDWRPSGPVIVLPDNRRDPVPPGAVLLTPRPEEDC